MDLERNGGRWLILPHIVAEPATQGSPLALISFHRWVRPQALPYRLRHQGVPGARVVLVAEGEILHIPAAGLAGRAGVLHGKELRKHRNEPLALAVAPVLPD